MDTSVNMKMSPVEYRLLRMAVEDAKEVADEMASRTSKHEGFDFTLSRTARERSKELAALLEKL